MTVIILAGGFGTRLRNVVKDVPKPMANINGKPFLEYLVDEYSFQQIENIYLSIGYKKECIIDYFMNKCNDSKINFCSEIKPLGTGGAIKNILDTHNIEEKYIFISNGDTFLNIQLKELRNFHYNNCYDITIAIVPMEEFNRYGSVEIMNNKVVSFKEKMYCKNGFVNAGTYIINQNIFDNFKLEQKFSFEEFLSSNINKLNIGAFVVEDSYFIDIGVPDDYEKAQIDFKEIF